MIQEAKKAFEKACEILGSKFATQAALVMVLAVGYQETKYLSRRQLVSEGGKLVAAGPAASWWQFEKGGGIAGVLKHHASAALALKLCEARNCAPTTEAVWVQMQYDDVLGAGFARLLLLTDPRALPAIGNSEPAWQCYIRNWRPGKPHPQTWATSYLNALKAAGV